MISYPLINFKYIYRLRFIENWVVWVYVLLLLNCVKIFDIPGGAHPPYHVSVRRERFPLGFRHDDTLIVLVIKMDPHEPRVMLLRSKSPFERDLLPTVANPTAILSFLSLNKHIFRPDREYPPNPPDIFYRNRVFLYRFMKGLGRDY